MQSYFVTGTDTGVGKTLIACALLRHMSRDGGSVVGMKPVAAGCDEIAQGWLNEDVEALRSASSVLAKPELMNPYLLKQPIAPHIAAAEVGLEIDLGHIQRCFQQLCLAADAVVVEGVGGFRVPFNEQQDSADMAVMLALPVILVVGVRLGCLNHALLTQEAIQARGLRLSGWVANRIDPQMLRIEENIEALRRRLRCPLLGAVPHLPNADPGQILLELPG